MHILTSGTKPPHYTITERPGCRRTRIFRCMGVLGLSVGAGLAAVTLLTVPVFIPALQPRGFQVGICLLG